jgi:hypothetical protein
MPPRRPPGYSIHANVRIGNNLKDRSKTMTDHNLFRISLHKIDFGRTHLTHGKVYGLGYDRLTSDTEVVGYEVTEQTYFLILRDLIMKSPKFRETNWDWSAPDYSLPFHMTVNDLAAMLVAHNDIMKVLTIVAPDATDLPMEVTRLYHADDAKNGVIHYVYFEHSFNTPESCNSILDTFHELHG